MNKTTHRPFLPVILVLVLFLSLQSAWPVQASSQHQDAPWPVVIVNSNIAANTIWTAGNVYYVMNDIEVLAGATLTIQGGTIVKFWVPYDPATATNLTGLKVSGDLRFTFSQLPPLDAERVVFTSGRDDSAGGDTNGDIQQTLPAPGDWDSVQLAAWDTLDPAVQYLNVRYGKDGLNIHNAGAVTYQPVISDNIFVENTCGLTLSLQNNGSITGLVSGNTFTENKYGFCTRRTNGNGQVNPTLANNDFNNNSILPIYLYGTSFPTYDSNTISGYIDPADKLGIGLGGVFNGSGALTIVDGMPFVIVAPMEVSGSATLTIPAGAVIKSFTRYNLAKTTDPVPGLTIYATNSSGVVFQSTEADPITFTSYRDDSIGGDTNGDDLDTEPLAGDWLGVDFRDQRAPTDPNYLFQWINFRYAVNGLWYETTTTQNNPRLPVIVKDSFLGNQNGLHFSAVSNNPNSRIQPTIQDCTFEKQGIVPTVKTDTNPGVPILLENTVQPTYVNNTFIDNLHPAIGIMGKWRSSVEFSSVDGQGLSPLPYLVIGQVWFGNKDIAGGVDTTGVFTFPAGTIVKFFVNNFERNNRSYLYAASQVQLQSTPEAPIIFTSYYDGFFGGATDGGVGISPTPGDWGEFLIRHPDSEILNTVFRYGDKALHVENKNTAVSAPFDAAIGNSVFEYNNFGLYLDIQATNDITSLISNNVFQYNSYGLGTFARDTLNSTPKVTGLSRPTLSNNQFIGNTTFPIFLNGSATLEYFEPSNQFVNNAHTAIALGGYFGAVSSDPLFRIRLPRIMAGPDAPLNGQLVPYVVSLTTNFDWNTPTTMDGGVVFKFDVSKELHFYGSLNMTTGPSAQNYFTSYRDDSVGGDTNGAPTPNPAPARGDWGGIYLANPASGPFSYATVQYAKDGLVIHQSATNPSPDDFNLGITNNTFQLNTNGLTFKIGSDYDILSNVANNIFVSNDYGIHTLTDTSVALHCGTADPTLTQNNFSLHSQFPLYLQGSSNPTYTDNLFWSNTHPAIAVGGTWCRDATWSKVHDNTFNQDMPYVVKETLIQENGVYYTPTITLPESLIVKFMADKYIYADGYLNLQSSPSKEIIFTSYLDDAYGGNIDAAPQPQSISRSAWKTVWLNDYPGKNNHIHDLKVYYSTAGLGVYYDGPENTQIATLIETTEFTNCHSAIVLVVGWRQVSSTVIYPGKGNINATLRNNNIHDSNYGVLTVAHDKSTGIINPVLENNTFTNIAYYPIFLGGTSYPSFTGANQINGRSALGNGLAADGLASSGNETNPVEDLAIGGLDAPGTQAVLESLKPGDQPLAAPAAPQAYLAASPNLFPAIGMAGTWNNAGELVRIEGVPYAIVGNFPLTVSDDGFSYKPQDNVTVGATNAANAAVAVPAGTVFKFATRLMMVVKGTLNLLSTDTQPVIFTSIKDDSADGDTNRDGITRPTIGDWGEVQLAASNAFHNAVVRYATKGLHIYFDGGVNLNNLTTVDHCTFTQNTTGISLTALDNGDISAGISHSTFYLNTIHIQGNPSGAGKTGHLCVKAHNNDLFGTKTTQNGIENNNLNGYSPALPDCAAPAFDATSNYWGDASGPYHPTLNIPGLGSRVSDRVAFDPWLGNAVIPPATYTISGRITKDTAVGDGLPGVSVLLQGDLPNELNTVTDENGYYSFSGLQNGNYFVSPGLQGYNFTPTSINITLAGADALDSNFIGTISLADVAFAVDSVQVIRPTSATPKTYCTFTVSIDKALGAGKSASVEYYTYAASAVDGVDYVRWSAKLTFLAGQSLTQKVSVEILPSNPEDPDKFFYFVLKNPINGTLLVSSGTCTILQQAANDNKVFIPFVQK
ncbi:Calx-beta domain/Carboxypeptidase regulatory-like domain/Right handed beta helix region [Longilinea arvoryzae]|uniref:Calx-beta domain/Carboxypeptidase regulatory-like domain/Right handed beta helix region n=1 Tax=Longilinea arvoryzae TaxID=360412 RepID=A0A0S7BCV7_9CHLR|nr:right-handed parallel beta-helix repeat-containing protein [Longilinea arvoryzae]GAP15711.1 Calx-beta domain/Carboxypeptidase regulatory-like domain/Right handed beta helix region [Longilinea arvoryzae]